MNSTSVLRLFAGKLDFDEMGMIVPVEGEEEDVEEGDVAEEDFLDEEG